MTKRRVRTDIPVRQPEKLIELAEAICKKNKTEKVLNENQQFHSFQILAVEARKKRNDAKVLSEKGKVIISESQDIIGIGKGQTRSTENTLYSLILQIRDHLKMIYKGKEEKIAEWGFQVDVFQIRSLRKVKIYIPLSSGEQLIELADAIGKHYVLEPSILKSFNMKDFRNNISKAIQLRDKAKKLHIESDKLIEESNLLIGLGYGQTKETPGTIFNELNEILKILLEKYKDAEEKLTEWGFRTSIVNSAFPIKGSGITTKKIIAVTNQKPLITVHIIFKGSKGKKVYITWGDGTADKLNLLGHTTPNSIYHDYLEEREYEINISGDIGKLSYFKINGNQIISIDMPKNLKNMMHVCMKNNLIDSNKIINNLFSNIDSAGVFNGELDVSGGSNAHPSSFGTISKNNLISRGWQVFTN